MNVKNRRASFDYHIEDTFEAGIVLTGPEVKSVKGGRIKLDGSHVRILAGEAFLINASIQPYEFATVENYNPSRTRKLLLHKKELLSLETKLARSNRTLIPISIYTNKRGVIKLQVGVALSKKQTDKRAKIRKRDLDRDVSRALRLKDKVDAK